MRIDLPAPDLFHRMLEAETNQALQTVAKGIALDSRVAKPGDLFVAIRGTHVDGHDFLEGAKENGCVAALVAKASRDTTIPQIKVNDPGVTIANLARNWRSTFSLPVVGITGSNGKTTTKDLLVHILSDDRSVHGTKGNHNTRLGLPLTLLELTSHHQLSIVEMGANQTGDIEYLCTIAHPRCGLITNIAPAHLQCFGSMENVVKAKGELFESLPSNGIAFVNADDQRIKLLPTQAKRITYGFTPQCDFASNLRREPNGLLSLTVNGYQIDLNSYNEVFAKNVAAACAVACTMDVSWQTIREQILSFHPTEGRCQLKTFDGITIIDDTYNANLESTVAAINFLSSYPASGKRIVVFGDMLELGSSSESHHRTVGEKCVDAGVDALFCYEQESRATVEAARSRISARHYNDGKRLAADLLDITKAGDVVLFKGSRGVAMETIMREAFGQ